MTYTKEFNQMREDSKMTTKQKHTECHKQILSLKENNDNILSDFEAYRKETDTKINKLLEACKTMLKNLKGYSQEIDDEFVNEIEQMEQAIKEAEYGQIIKQRK